MELSIFFSILILINMLVIAFIVKKIYDIQNSSIDYIKKLFVLNYNLDGTKKNKNPVLPTEKQGKSEAYHPKKDIIAQMSGKIIDIFN